ncbi:MAG: L-rhamnose isomerase [Candidatus Omnitrophica bacterium]|nr:L-rhamnose isomerase [Candidatus Omnitrophota bacterium]
MSVTKWIENGIENLSGEFGEEKVKKAVELVKNFEVEIPTWSLGPFGGGRFGSYTPPGYAKNINQKLEDAAFINKLTGAAPMVSAHILWDFSKDGMEADYETALQVRDECKERNLGIGSINPTYFLKGSESGSLTSPCRETRKRYIEQTILGGRLAKEIGNGTLSLWFPDGSLYPGQIDLKETYLIMKDSLIECRRKIPEEVTMLIEYKVFEPGTYSTTVPGWGTSYLLAKSMGGNAGVLIDLGHHHHGTNIEQIVAMLIAEDMRCGFHFNTRYSADDDHAVEPNQENARIFYELLSGGVVAGGEKNWAYMIDQASGRENRIHALLHSLDSLQLSLAKAALVNTDGIKECREKDEIMLANRLFNDAIINADVRPVAAKARIEKGLPPDPVKAYLESGYQQKIGKR